MTNFHITRGGKAAPCEARLRPCPLGDHYTSLRAAASAALVLILGTSPHGSSSGLPQAQQSFGLPDGHTTRAPKPQSIVEFGKYRGEPLSYLLDDRAYCRWLLTQDWFRQKYPDVFRRVREHREVAQLRSDFHRT